MWAKIASKPPPAIVEVKQQQQQQQQQQEFVQDEYNFQLILEARICITLVQKIEKSFDRLLRCGAQSTTTSANIVNNSNTRVISSSGEVPFNLGDGIWRIRLRPMSSDQRRLVHTLAEHYLFETESFEAGRNRSVEVRMKSERGCRCPPVLLSVAAARNIKSKISVEEAAFFLGQDVLAFEHISYDCSPTEAFDKIRMYLRHYGGCFVPLWLCSGTAIGTFYEKDKLTSAIQSIGRTLDDFCHVRLVTNVHSIACPPPKRSISTASEKEDDYADLEWEICYNEDEIASHAGGGGSLMMGRRVQPNAAFPRNAETIHPHPNVYQALSIDDH